VTEISTLPPQWTPIALARDIAPGTAAGAVLDGAEIVVWRDTAGHVRAWEDRCPHRGMKLSFGFVRGDRIACLYHGWEYDGSATCRYIPAHPDLAVPATIRAGRHAVAEASGLVWVAPEGTAGLPPDMPGLTPLRSLFLDVPAAIAMARLAEGGLPGGGDASARHAGPFLRLAQGGLSVLVAHHAPGPGSCALHLLVEGDAAPAALVAATACFRDAVEGVEA
jgi:nitrite reductase/ring-hydroxylating ferredoxin subunit